MNEFPASAEPNQPEKPAQSSRLLSMTLTIWRHRVHLKSSQRAKWGSQRPDNLTGPGGFLAI
jgi:hypothetical protein